jgi:predicted DNA-binding transcriptional regulator YafY
MIRIEAKLVVLLMGTPEGRRLSGNRKSNTGQDPPGIAGILEPMSRPTSRVLALLEILQAGGTRRAGELAERLGVDERTVRRYAEHLVDLDIPVRSVRGRYGGYQLAPGYRMPPLMLTDEEAVAVLLGLVVGRRAGLVPESSASESALAKLRRVLPTTLRDRLEALLATASFTAASRSSSLTETAVLLTLAEAAQRRQPVEIGYTDRQGRASARIVEPHGIVAHSGHWYLTAVDPKIADQRTFRLDRILAAELRPGSFDAPPGDPAEKVLASLARTPWAHSVSLRVRGRAGDLERRLPLGLAVVEVIDESWVRVRLNVESLDWLPALIAGLDRPFVIEQPDELRERMSEFAHRLTGWAAQSSS